MPKGEAMKPRLSCMGGILILSLWWMGCGKGDQEGGGVMADWRKVPRSRTLILDCPEPTTCAGQIGDFSFFNPYLPTGTSRTGWNFLYEPLY